MQNLEDGDLTIELSREDNTSAPFRLVWKGKANARRPSDALVPFFTELIACAREGGVGIENHFEHVLHLNSSTISCVVQMMHRSREQGVMMGVTYDGKVAWQRLCFEALRVLDRGDGLLVLRTI